MQINLPTHEQCLQYFEDYKVPQNIKDHCIKVMEVSEFLGKKAHKSNLPVNQDLIKSLAILHDLFKMISIKQFGEGDHKEASLTEEQETFWREMRTKYPQKYEGEVAYEIFKNQFPELAVALKNVSNPRIENPTWEELIVHYADTRVFQNNIVTLYQRIEYLKKMYPRSDEIWDTYTQKQETNEKKIMATLNLKPETLKLQLMNN